VARVELAEEVGIEHYAAVPEIGAECLEIQFIDVAVAARGRGIGTGVVRGLSSGIRIVGYRLTAKGQNDFGRPSAGIGSTIPKAVRSCTALSSFSRRGKRCEHEGNADGYAQMRLTPSCARDWGVSSNASKTRTPNAGVIADCTSSVVIQRISRASSVVWGSPPTSRHR